MKNLSKIVSILLVVAIVCSFGVVLVACDKTDNDQTASNGETLATAMAVATSYSGYAAAEEEKSGISITGDAAASIPATIKPAFDYVVKQFVNLQINSTTIFASENVITVEAIASTDDAYSIEYKISFSNGQKDESGNEVVSVMYLFIKAEAVASDGTKTEVTSIEENGNYLITAKLTMGSNSLTFTCNATYVNNVEKFGFTLGVGSSAMSIAAYSEKDGSIVVEVNGTVMGVANAKFKVELGALDNGKYGADAEIECTIEYLGVSFKVDVEMEVSATHTDTEITFAVNGDAEVKFSEPILNTQWEADMAITGSVKATDTNTAMSITINVNAFENVAE